VRAARAARASRLVRRREPRRRRPGRARLHDGMNRISPFVRNLAILALIALVIVVLDLQASLITASFLLRVAFFLAIAFVAYMLWRDFGRREISLWPQRAQWVFYAAVGLFVVDLGWFFLGSLRG